MIFPLFYFILIIKHNFFFFNNNSYYVAHYLVVFFFFFENTKYFQHTYGEMGECFFKETYSGIYPKGSNSWIYSTDFKHFLLTLFLRKCGINPIFFLLIILNIFNIHMEKGEKVFFNTI